MQCAPVEAAVHHPVLVADGARHRLQRLSASDCGRRRRRECVNLPTAQVKPPFVASPGHAVLPTLAVAAGPAHSLVYARAVRTCKGAVGRGGDDGCPSWRQQQPQLRAPQQQRHLPTPNSLHQHAYTRVHTSRQLTRLTCWIQPMAWKPQRPKTVYTASV